MDVLLEELWILGCMRIVARFAIHYSGFDPDMGLVESIPRHIVALAAQRLNGLLQQRGFSGNVRLMARRTVTGRRRMSLFLIHSCL